MHYYCRDKFLFEYKIRYNIHIWIICHRYVGTYGTENTQTYQRITQHLIQIRRLIRIQTNNFREWTLIDVFAYI
jgi:hypothetical protein